VSDITGWTPKSIDAWCLQAAPLIEKKTSTTAFAVSRLCEVMQLKSVEDDAIEFVIHSYVYYGVETL
jgi:hypothetical protein